MTDTLITPQQVKELRERTGAGVMDCKRALQSSDGEVERAVALLREQGMATAAKKSGREAREGVVSSYIHTGGRVGVLVEVNCETDFVARTDDFQRLVREVAMQIAGLSPLYTTIDSIPADALAAKRAEFLDGEDVKQKPERIREQIVDGKIHKWQTEVVLYEQAFRDTEQTVGQRITEAIARIGENILVRRFTRYALGEEL
jgi:elongation factor Ts